MVSRLQRHGSHISRNRSQMVVNEEHPPAKTGEGRRYITDLSNESTRDKHRGVADLATAGRCVEAIVTFSKMEAFQVSNLSQIDVCSQLPL